MFKSILAVSEGGPDAAMSFKLATRVAGIFDGTVDALHLPVGPAGGMAGGLAMSGEAFTYEGRYLQVSTDEVYGDVEAIRRARLVVYLGHGFQPALESALADRRGPSLDALRAQRAGIHDPRQDSHPQRPLPQ